MKLHELMFELEKHAERGHLDVVVMLKCFGTQTEVEDVSFVEASPNVEGSIPYVLLEGT